MARKKRQLSKRAILFSYLIPVLLILIGICLISIYSYWRLSHIYLSFQSVPATVSAEQGQFALGKQLVIPKLGISLSITEAIISGGVWQVSDTGVSHLNTSALPGQRGSIIVYGHNKAQFLKPIEGLKTGDMIEIKTADTTTHQYVVDYTLVVSPSETWVLNSLGRERLVLYTCTGFFDLKRFVVFANPVI